MLTHYDHLEERLENEMCSDCYIIEKKTTISPNKIHNYADEIVEVKKFIDELAIDLELDLLPGEETRWFVNRKYSEVADQLHAFAGENAYIEIKHIHACLSPVMNRREYLNLYLHNVHGGGWPLFSSKSDEDGCAAIAVGENKMIAVIFTHPTL